MFLASPVCLKVALCCFALVALLYIALLWFALLWLVLLHIALLGLSLLCFALLYLTLLYFAALLVASLVGTPEGKGRPGKWNGARGSAEKESWLALQEERGDLAHVTVPGDSQS